ncbi:HAD-IA family hydrolase [Shewanella sp. A32]|uniref:HAD-IA family hydrolase n=1 Tax=Shewanella sp. A32 TaxID=3031327 RepID=UPI0023B893B4|nr:HAD-IA family hydrolase [Shewanella sp. A32]MDF0534980.1 HAD-IA family hydrolase [Shewanella sp. A32]
MHSFLRLSPFRAISFDLDDTLYNNKPIIAAAEVQLLRWLQQQYPATAAWSQGDWRNLKLQVLSQQPQLIHDTSATRQAVLHRGLKRLGYDDTVAHQGAIDGLNYFYRQRSDFKVSAAVLTLLRELAEYWPLVGITNGNVDEQAIGLDGVFSFVLHPGNGVRMKPFPDLFMMAAEKLDVTPAELLHVGDHPDTDVKGARMAGCQTIWLNPGYGQTARKLPGALLPHCSIASLAQLRPLLLIQHSLC